MTVASDCWSSPQSTVAVNWPAVAFGSLLLKYETISCGSPVTRSAAWAVLVTVPDVPSVSLTVTAVCEEDGTVSGYLGVANDLTARKAAEEDTKGWRTIKALGGSTVHLNDDAPLAAIRRALTSPDSAKPVQQSGAHSPAAIYAGRTRSASRKHVSS